MELTIIGSGTGIPSRTRAYPCTLVKIEDYNLIFDTGPGSLRQLFLAGVTYMDIDYIYYSHFHPDHSLDLVSFLFAMKYHEPKRTKPLYVFGPPGLRQFHGGMEAVYGSAIQPKTFDVHIEEIDTGKRRFPDWEIWVKSVRHSTQSIGYRLETEDGKTFVYSGDTDYCDSIVRLAEKANVLLLECSFPDDRKSEGHLTPQLCAKIANESQCKKLILTHFYPVCSSAVKNDEGILQELKKIYSGDIIFGEDFERFVI